MTAPPKVSTNTPFPFSLRSRTHIIRFLVKEQSDKKVALCRKKALARFAYFIRAGEREREREQSEQGGDQSDIVASRIRSKCHMYVELICFELSLAGVGRRRNRQLMRPLLHTNWGPRAAAFNLQERQRRRPRAVLWWWRDSTHIKKVRACLRASVCVRTKRSEQEGGRVAEWVRHQHTHPPTLPAGSLISKHTHSLHLRCSLPAGTSLFWELLINLESAFLSTSKPDTSLVIENEFLITGREHPLSLSPSRQ